MDVQHIGIDRSVEAVFPPERLREALADLDAAVTVVDGSPDALADCDAVVTFEHRDAFLGVDWVHSIQAGVDRFPFDALEAEGVALTSSAGIHGPAIGETVAGYLLMFRRRLHRAVAHQQRREWQPPAWDEASTLAGDTVCVVGLGTLGRGIADAASALGCRVVGVRASADPVEGVERVYGPDALEAAVGGADFVALAVPLTDETHHLVDADVLAAMPEDAYLVNVARGPVVDEAALVEALEAGTIAGAALDVFETEPLPSDSPLWDLEEVVVTPHCAAFTVDYHRNVADLVRRSVSNLRAGGDLVNRVV